MFSHCSLFGIFEFECRQPPNASKHGQKKGMTEKSGNRTEKKEPDLEAAVVEKREKQFCINLQNLHFGSLVYSSPATREMKAANCIRCLVY